MKHRQRKNVHKRVTAFATACIMVFISIFTPEIVHASSETAIDSIRTNEQAKTEVKNDLSVEGTNSFGNIVAGEFSREAAQQQENNGCNIFSIEITGTTADISYETVEDCTLVVGIYEEDEIKMLAVRKIDVLANETHAAVEFEPGEIPEYFWVRGFLVDTETLQPLCMSYESPMYTQEMQEFLAKTTNDFDAGLVLNLDEDTTNNFAVYNEETIRIPQNEDANQIVSADETNHVYVIENADENISSLQPDDIFSYEYGENELLIVKVANVRMDGTTATVTGADASMEEIFDYVKIDGESGLEDAVVDPSTCGESVSYEGIVDYEEEDEVQAYAWEGGGNESFALSYKFMDKKLGTDSSSVKLSGSLDLKLEASLKFYIALKYQYLELKIDYSGKLGVALSGNARGKVGIGNIGISPIPGVYIEFTPSFVVEASAKIEFDGKLTGTVGFSVSNDEGMRNLTSSPSLKGEIKGEVTIFLGLSLEPKIKILSDAIAYASLDATLGGELTAKMDIYKKPSSSKLHGCTRCIDGDISGKAEVKFEVKLLNSDKWKYTCKAGRTVKLFDFYYSLTYGDFDFTTCPHYWYLTDVTVLGENGEKIVNAKIKAPFSISKTQQNGTVTDVGNLTDADYITTGEDGKAIGYLPAGKYTLEISADGYETEKKKITVVDDCKEIVVRVKKKAGGSVVNPSGSTKVKEVKTSVCHTFALMENGDLYMWGTNYSKADYDLIEPKLISMPVKIMEHVLWFKIEGGSYEDIGIVENIAILCENGNLYMLGTNWGNEEEQSSWIPVKILANVSSVCLTDRMAGGAITKDGDLYTWNRELTSEMTPVKILSNVERIIGDSDICGVITKDRSLYMWGYNYEGQLGNGTTEDSFIPVKVLDNVVDASTFPCSSAITEDGSLYTWGANNKGGILGNGTIDNSLVPVKVLSNVASLDWIYFKESVFEPNYFDYTARAVTKDGSLYVWGGANKHGSLGNGTTNGSLVPMKILDNVASVEGSCGAITKDGSLYKWGKNSNGELGNGTTEDSLFPVKVLDNVKTVYWKSNQWQELGNTKTEEEATRIRISDYLVGNVHTVITKNGNLYRWGNNANGGLGNGTTENSLIPVKVLDNVEFSDGTRAITKDGSLYAWGYNGDGRLGNGTTENSLVPIKVLDDVVYANEDCDSHVSSVITKNGDLYMWGDNRYGQLGNGTTEDSLIPVKVNFPDTVAASSVASESMEENSGFFSLPESTSAEITLQEKSIKRDSSNERADSNMSCTYSDLLPNETYNFYAVRSKSVDDLLAPDNLLCIQQAVTDETGKMNISYGNMDVESLVSAETFIVGFRKTDISKASMTVPDLKYDGTKQFVTPQVTYQGNTLVEGKDYEMISGYGATDSGTYTVTISGTGIYTGTLSADYQIVCNHTYKPGKVLKKASVGGNGLLEQKCSICGSSKTEDVHAVKMIQVSSDSFIYNGKVQKPSVTVTDSTGAKLKNGTDYDVDYASGCKNVGIYQITITLKGNYSGNANKSFTIKPKGTSISKVSALSKGLLVKWKKQKNQTIGYEIQYAANKKFKKAKTLKNIKAKTTSKRVTKLKAKKKYYIRIRTYKTIQTGGKSVKLYSGWSKVKKVTTKK